MMIYSVLSLRSNNYRYLSTCSCCLEAQMASVPNFGRNIFRKNGVLFDDIYGLSESMAIEESSRFQYGDECSDKGEGNSIVYFANSVIYEGPIDNDKFNGNGSLTIDGNLYYEGEFKNNKFHGKGKLHSFYGDIYEGDFVNGCAEGMGKVKWEGGFSYEGTFKENMIDGWGTYKFADGSTYVGNYNMGMRSGRGILTIKYDNIEYKLSSLEWTFDIIEGVGGISDSINNRSYSGGMRTFFKLSQPGVFHFTPHGKGSIVDKGCTEVFSGEFVNGLRNGEGMGFYPNGIRRFYGTFKNNMHHGKGICYNKEGKIVYNGNFHRNRRHGEAWVYHYDDKQNEIYREYSNFKYDRRFGKSTSTDSNFKTDVRYYYHNELVSAKKFSELDEETQKILGPEQCPISQCGFSESEEEITKLSCGHTFHTDHLFKWLESNESCPMCRSIDIFKVADEEPGPKKRKV